MIRKIKNALTIGWWAFRNTQTIQQNNLEMLSKLLALILEVATTDRHRMSHIAYIHPEDGTEQQIASIWAGAGAAADPTKRIAELLEENSKLKSLLANSVNQ